MKAGLHVRKNNLDSILYGREARTTNHRYMLNQEHCYGYCLVCGEVERPTLSPLQRQQSKGIKLTKLQLCRTRQRAEKGNF